MSVVTNPVVAGGGTGSGGGGGGATTLAQLTDINTTDIAALNAPTGARFTALGASLTGHINNAANPHGTTKTQLGLGNVDNVSDANKPVSSLQQAAIAAATGGSLILVSFATAIPLDTPGFGKGATAVIDLAGGAKVLTQQTSPGPVARGSWTGTFVGDGNSAHSVTVPVDWVHLQGPVAVNTALGHYTRMYVEYDADIGHATYVLQDIVTSGQAAGAILMDGPSAGVVSVASANFTLQADGTLSGSVICTPNDNGGGGNFTPTTLTLTALAPTGTFIYTPASTGIKTIRVTNASGLTNPQDLPYVSNAANATAITMSGPTTGTNGQPSLDVVFGANGSVSGTIIVTPAATGGGTFSPATVSLTAGSPTGTSKYTPASTGTKTISCTNDRSLTAPSTIAYVSTGAAGFFEDDMVAMTGVLAGRTPSVSNANGNTWVNADGGTVAQFNACSVGNTEGVMMDMGANASWRFDIVCQIPDGGGLNLCCKDDTTQFGHTTYMFDMFAYDQATGKVEYWNVGPSWDIFTDVATVGTLASTIPSSSGLHKYSLVVDDVAHTGKFYIDDVQVGSTRTIRTNAGRNDVRFTFGVGGGYVTHAKMS